MELRFNDIISDGIEKYLGEKGISRDKANTIQLGKSLTEFYVREIGTFTFGFYDDNIEEGLGCDGKGDLNVDFATQKESDFIVIQSKYKGVKSHVSSDELSGFFNIHYRILDKSYFRKHANEELQDALREYKAGDPIQYVFVTNYKITDKLRDEFKLLKVHYEKEHEGITYELKGYTELKTDYKTVTSEADSIPSQVDITIESTIDSFIDKDVPAYVDLSGLIDDKDKYRSVVCCIKGTTLRGLWQHHRGSLFNYNIRGFLGDNPVNKKIKETIEKEPENFYFYNNGISAICTEINPKISNGKVIGFTCKNFQIINGAQTTSTIGKFRDDEQLHKVRVLLRITKAEDSKKEKGLNKKIITYNNSQTIIKASDFRSNDDIQIFLETKLQDYEYKGIRPFKKSVYLRKRLKIDGKKKDKLFITMETLARVLYVFDHDPILIFKGTKYLFDVDVENNGKYWLIFGEDNQEVSFFNQTHLTKIVALFFLWTKIEELLKAKAKSLKETGQEKSIEYQALLAKWHFLWAYGYLLKAYHSKDVEALYKKIASGKLFENDTTFINKWFNKIHKTLSKCLEKNYRSTRKQNESEIQSFNYKNWLRSEAEFQNIETEFKYTVEDDFPLV